MLSPRRWSKPPFVIMAFAASFVVTPASAQTAAPSYATFKEGVFLRYRNAEPRRIAATPQIGLSFGDRIYRAVLDSGSTGVVVAAKLIPGFEHLPSLGEGQLTYTSSGRVMIGQWVRTTLALVGQGGETVRTEPMPVLAVTRVACLRESRDCVPNDDPRDIAMVGVGFAREHDRQAESTPDKNPLLRVDHGGRQQRRGYVLTAQGVHVGLTSANTNGEFRYLKLSKQADGSDWSAIPACISINGLQPPACGSALVDTGVSAMFLTVPPQQTGDVRQLPAGTAISISVGDQGSANELYAFTVGGNSPLAPEAIHLKVSDRRVFVNTSYHLLNGYDLLYDADGGYVGFRKR